MQCSWLFLVAGLLVAIAAEASEKKHHHRHHRHHHHHHGHRATSNATLTAVNATAQQKPGPAITTVSKPTGKVVALTPGADSVERQTEKKMKVAEKQLVVKEASRGQEVQRTLAVNGPLPSDFATRFAEAVAQATGTRPSDVHLLKASSMHNGVVDLIFRAAPSVADAAQDQAADPDSKLATGPLHDFLVAKNADSNDEPEEAGKDMDQADVQGEVDKNESQEKEVIPTTNEGQVQGNSYVKDETLEKEEPQEKGVIPSPIDVDAAMPYGQLEPFGREDTAQELTEQSISESNEMVDQLERAEVAEEKRAVFRALTRLRGAAITAFDGIARSQTGSIDEYSKRNNWRSLHPLHHLAQEEADISKWAFPDF